MSTSVPEEQAPAVILVKAYDHVLWSVQKAEKLPRLFRLGVSRANPTCPAASAPFVARGDEGFGRHAGVLRDLAKEDRGEVATRVERECGLSAVGMPILPMRAPLAHEGEPEALEEPLDLPRLEHGK